MKMLRDLPIPAIASDEIDNFVQEQMGAQNIPGLVLRLRKGRKTVLHKAYGVSNVDTRTPTRVTDRFEMGSIGKSFTATMTLQLAEARKLSLDDPVRKYLPEVPSNWDNISIRHLLSQTSGLPDYAFQDKLAYDQTYSSEDWRQVMYSQPLEYQPGQIFAYSNTNYVLLGMVIERITKVSYEVAAQEMLFKPLQMAYVEFRSGLSGVLPRAEGYYNEDGKLVPAGPGVGAPIPSDGGGFCSVDDLFRYGDALISGKLVGQSWVDQATRPFEINGRPMPYGFGWFVQDRAGVRVIYHGGNGVGYSACLTYVPSRDLSVSMMCNVYPVRADEFALSVARLTDPSLKENALVSAQIDPDPARTALLLEATRALACGKLDDPKFHEDLKATYSTGRGQLNLGSLAQLGALESMHFVDEQNVGPDRVLRYMINENYHLKFTIEPAGKLIQFNHLRNPV